MNTHEHHQDLIKGIGEQFAPILNFSKQAIYIYLDDMHKVCNKKFASLLGYASPAEWAAVEQPFPQVFVAKKSQETLVTAYSQAMQKLVGSAFPVIWKKKDGSKVDTQVILVPVSYQKHIFALHFISE